MTIHNPNVEFVYKGRTYRLNLSLVDSVRTYGGRRAYPGFVINSRKNALWRKKHPFMAKFYSGPFFIDSWDGPHFIKPRTVIQGTERIILEVPAKNLDEARQNTKRLREIIYTFRGYFS